MISVNGLGIGLTATYAVWAVWYFLLSGSWNPLEGAFGWFGPANFQRNFSIIAPAYLSLEALLVGTSMTMSASTRGRIWMVVNVITTVLMLLFVVVLRAKASEWGVEPGKWIHINFAIYMSALDVILTFSIALLVSLAHRTFGISGSS